MIRLQETLTLKNVYSLIQLIKETIEFLFDVAMINLVVKTLLYPDTKRSPPEGSRKHCVCLLLFDYLVANSFTSTDTGLRTNRCQSNDS